MTPRQVIDAIAGAVHELGLPHPVHVHCNNLGVAGNWRTTLDTLRTLEGRRAHLAHLQFHAYGGKPGGRPRSQAPEIAEYLGAHPELSADVGQVMFGPATTMTADAPVSARAARHHRRQVGERRHRGRDRLRDRAVHLQARRTTSTRCSGGSGSSCSSSAATRGGLVLSTDHPNGGSFLSYPQLIRLLMDRDFRNEQLRRANKKAIRSTVLLDDLDREYTLERDRDHHARRAGAAARPRATRATSAPGADADVTIYDEHADREEMFATPRYVIKGGRVVVRDGELVEALAGDLLRVDVPHDPAVEDVLRDAVRRALHACGSTNYPVREPWLLEPARQVAARPRDAPPRRRGRGHVRRGVPDVGRADRRHRRHAGLGRARRRARSPASRRRSSAASARPGSSACSTRRRRPTGARASPPCCSPPTRRASASGSSSASARPC